MSRIRKARRSPGDIFTCPETGARVRINAAGEEEPWQPAAYDPWAEWDREPEPDRLEVRRRADGTIAPFHNLDHDQLEALGQDTPRNRRTRHDGWTLDRQKDFIERLAATASVTDAARYVGLSRQSARDLYNRSAPFRAAWDEALRAAVSVLAETAFDRAVNGVQEQVWYQGRMVGFREKYNDRLLMFLLRVRDPLNFAPLDDLQGWQRHRPVEDRSRGMGPAIDRLEAAEQAWASAEQEPPPMPAPADRLDAPADSPAPDETPPAERAAPCASSEACPARREGSKSPHT